eukprot:1133419-Pelagomonas_calceolata.AAC.3
MRQVDLCCLVATSATIVVTGYAFVHEHQVQEPNGCVHCQVHCGILGVWEQGILDQTLAGIARCNAASLTKHLLALPGALRHPWGWGARHPCFVILGTAKYTAALQLSDANPSLLHPLWNARCRTR